ncbi:hypothetical protein BU23DRAFT_538382 [Bimuria novae-zelandiae CBS 107.79]|uniref:Uncharacterized protein n=1 Tax=Bimuria novae-zelandiae CBS 107.79 TaxID=1447943 RepID=A0A6A5V4Z4_9PLEO|nr:hypothetical protein BU23DRAFT_538382 [Bimuria novae-zelandiae CBS 107.79]
MDKKHGETQFKAAHGLLVAFLTLIVVLHALGIYLFTSGFLLTRIVLDHRSECAAPPADGAAGSPQRGCWHPKTFEKAVVVLIDALRYDFTVPQPAEQAHHFHNALTVLHETAVAQPRQAFLLPFIADAPTATLQRLKGLTTGTLPTFVDAGSNFAGTAIDEDNLVSQLRRARKTIVHLGDDTWHALFPGHFDAELTRAYDSFNVWDLHTVDNGVSEHVFPLMHAANASKWDVVIAHYLGVDHAGHRYGPDHPAMAAKLRQMDAVIRDMIRQLDDSTLLVVMGDHGMDAKGDHGGESDDEIQAALWMYSKQPRFGRSSPAYAAPPQTAKERSVAQIDLVPTLSLLLGLPIPFNNLGRPIEEAFIGPAGADYHNLATVSRLTAAQIYRYQEEMASVQSMDEVARASSLASFGFANDAWDAAVKAADAGRFAHVYELYTVYQQETLDICKALWASFDLPRMLNGVTILTLTLVLLAVYARGVAGDVSELSPQLLSRGGFGALASSLIGAALPEVSRQHSIIYAVAMGSNLGIASSFWSLRRRLLFLLPTTIWGYLSATFAILLSVGFAANSFTIWEDEILLHFLSTFGLLSTLSSFRQPNMTDRVLGVYHSVLFVLLSRLASLSRLCREEQMPYCQSTYYASATSSTSATWQLVLPLIVALLLPTFIRGYYDGTLSYQNSAIMWLGFGLRFGLLLSAVYWTLDAADDGEWYPSYGGMLKTLKTVIAQVTLAIAIGVGAPTFIWAKPFLNIEEGPPHTHKPHPSKQIVPKGPNSGASIAVLGYGNVHGSRYAILITIWYLALALVQKPMGAGALALCAWQIFSLLEIVATNQLASSAIGPVILSLMGSFHFFKTGHQATLSSIQWESAFIPLHTIRYPWSPLLVVMNTFGAQILCAVAVPALVLWKQQPRKKGLLGDVARAVATHILFYASVSLATTMWAGHLRRHLMLYRIFSPRFMMGAMVLLVVDLVSVFVAVVGMRVSSLSVAEVFGVTM